MRGCVYLCIRYYVYAKLACLHHFDRIGAREAVVESASSFPLTNTRANVPVLTFPLLNTHPNKRPSHVKTGYFDAKERRNARANFDDVITPGA